MNIKKMFTTLSAMVVAVMFTLPNASVFAATYSAELTDAYNWAYSKGVTTQSPIDNANMYGAITRAEMAKMLSVYAMEVLGLTPDTSRACTFTDIASVKGDLHDYIITSCQLGIMGQGITEFRPYAQIPRSEFGTALSRTLWGSTYDGGTPFYAKHLDALKAAGIMTQISNAESMKEVRGYVMLMLMRAEGNEAVVDCDDPMTVIACTTDTDACPAACREAEDNTPTVVKAGDLYVTATPAEGKRVVINVDDQFNWFGGVSDLDTLTFKTSEEVTISKITLERYGYSDGLAISGIWLEDADGNMITEPKALNNKDRVTLSVKKDYRTVDGTLKATIVVEMGAATPAEAQALYLSLGGTLGFKVVKDWVESTAKNLNLDDYTPYEYTISFYKGSAITVDRLGSAKNYNYEAGEMYEVARFRVKASNSPVLINGFTLANELTTNERVDGVTPAGQADIAKYLDKVVVTVNGEKISARYSVNKDDELVISFDEYELDAKQSASFVVSLSLDEFEDYGRWVKYVLTSNNLKAVEKKTWARVTVNVALGTDGWAGHLFRWGKVKLTNNKLGTVEAASGSVNILVAEGEISVGEPIKMAPFLVVTDIDNIDAMTLIIAGEEYDGKKGTYVVGVDEYDDEITAEWFQFSKVVIEKSGEVEFRVEVNEDADTPSVRFSIAGKSSFGKEAFAGAEYEELRNSPVADGDVSGSITFATLKIKAPTASLENNLAKSKAIEFVVDQPDRKVVFDGTYTAKNGDVNLNSFWFISNTTPDALAQGKYVTFYVFVDGEEVGSTDVFGANKVERFSDVKVKKWTSVKVKVEAAVDVSAEDNVATTDPFNYDLYLAWEDADGNDAWEGSDFVAPIKIRSTWSVTIPATKSNTVLLKGMSQTIAEFTVKPSNGNEGIYLDTLDLAITATPALPNDFDPARDLRVKVAWQEVTFEWDTHMYYPEKELPKEGVVVEVILRGEASGKYVVTATVNGVSKTLNREFVPALVTVEKQENKGDYTRYTLGVEKYNEDYEVKSLVFYAGTCQLGNDGIGGEDCTPVAPAKDTVSDGNYLEADNETSTRSIVAIEYDVAIDSNPDHNVTVSLLKTTYEDFFLVGDEALRVFSNK